MIYDSVFIHAHACRLDKKFKLSDKMTKGNPGKIRLYFKTSIDTCLNADSTQIDLKPENYIIKESQKNPIHLVDDYSLEFRDPMQDFGLETFGIFAEDEKSHVKRLENLYNREKHINLSNIIQICNELYKTTKFYLHICRERCISTPKKSKSKSKGGKYKKRISIKFKNKRKLI